MATAKEIGIVLSKFRALFPNYNPTDITATAEVWREVVGHIPGDEFRIAAMAASVEPGRAFAPSVGEVLGAVMRIRAQVSGLPSSIEAWNQVRGGLPYRHADCWDSYAMVSQIDNETGESDYLRIYFELIEHNKTCEACKPPHQNHILHPLVLKVALDFGYPKDFPGDNPEADRAHFIRAYEAEVTRQTQREAQPVQVQKYIELNAGRVSGAIAQLAEGMSKP